MFEFLVQFDICFYGANWQLYICSANGLRQTGDKPLPEPMMTKFTDAPNVTQPQCVNLGFLGHWNKFAPPPPPPPKKKKKIT